jgi:hypothetical protein
MADFEGGAGGDVSIQEALALKVEIERMEDLVKRCSVETETRERPIRGAVIV